MIQSITLLITDDEQEILDSIEMELKRIDPNLNIIKVQTGRESLQLIQTGDIDILLTDIAMPDMDGFELNKRVKEIRPNIPIIMMTSFGYDPEHIVVNSKRFGLDEVILKPIDYSKLISLIYKCTFPPS